jgi:putative ABC transport system substrate-binding protein
MRRREFIAGIGGAAAWPLAARAQQTAVPVIGYLGNAPLQINSHLLAAFRLGLKEVGYVEGQNLTIEYRWYEGRNERLPALAAELVRRKVAVIATGGGTALALAAKASTQTIPVVFMMGSDAIEIGLVASYNRPGGNLTGVALFGLELIAKRLQLLHELVPATTSIALLSNPTNPANEFQERETKIGARALGLGLQVLNASVSSELEGAFATVVQERVGAIVVMDDPFFVNQRNQIVALSSLHAVAAIYPYREFTAAGGLMSYGPSLADSLRQVGVYTGRILKGEKPADLPVLQPAKFDLSINLGTAKRLGLDVPETLLATADEVIK